MLSVKSLALTVLCLFAVTIGTASAQSTRGPYIGFAGGVNLLNDSDFDILAGVNVDNEYDPGYAIAGFLGYDFGPVWSLGGVRVEGEISYRLNDIDVHSVGALGGDQPGSDGDASALAFMANVYHDFSTETRFQPYFGGGLGVAIIDFSDYGIAAVPDVLDDEDTTFAWQLIGGVAYEISNRLSVGLEYRYFSAEPRLTSSTATSSVSNDVDYDNHSVMLRLNHRF